MRRVITGLTAGLLTLVLLILAACSSAGPATTAASSKTQAATTAAPKQTTAAATPSKTQAAPEGTVTVKLKKLDGTPVDKVVEKAKYGGEVTFAWVSPAAGFDMGHIDGLPQFVNRIGGLTYNTLLQGDWARGPCGTGEASWKMTGFYLPVTTGSIAESWEVPKDGQIIFHLRKGIHFALDSTSEASKLVNGRELTANDVVYSITRSYLTPKTYLGTTAPGDLKLVQATATDNWTVDFRCDPVYTGMYLENVGSLVRVIPHEVVEKYGNMTDWKVAVGSGPFLFKDYVPDTSLTFARNPKYWVNDPLQPENQLPYLDGVKILIMLDSATRYAALRTGKLDFERDIDLEMSKQIVQQRSDLLSGSVYGTAWQLFMRSDLKPFSDKRVRQALYMAIDYPTIIKDYYGGKAAVDWFPAPPIAEWAGVYTPLDKLPESTRDLYTYHPDKAKKLLADAGYPQGFKTTVMCRKDNVTILSMYAKYFADIGVTLSLDVKEDNVWLTTGAAHTYEGMATQWTAIDRPYKLLQYTPKAPKNMSIVNDENVNNMFADISAHYFDPAYCQKVFKEKLSPYLMDQAWIIEFPLPETNTLWWPWLKNYHGERSPGYMNLEANCAYVWIDQQLKAKLQGTK